MVERRRMLREAEEAAKSAESRYCLWRGVLMAASIS